MALTSSTAVDAGASAARRLARRLLHAVADSAARSYVAGDNLEDALALVDARAERGEACTVGHFNGEHDLPEQVFDRYVASIDALAGTTAHLSIKLTALGRWEHGGSTMARALARRAAAAGVRLHADAMWPASADGSRLAVETMREEAEIDLGITLPGRWLRSVADAEWARDRGLHVRVVKGQWQDPGAPDRDPSRGVLDVIERLAGRAAHVAIASHDPALVALALQRLTDARTPCGLEILHGWGARAVVEVARGFGVPVRTYVPFGQGSLPYAAGLAVRDPALALRLGSDFARSLLRSSR